MNALRVAALVLLPLQVIAQIRAGCSPASPTVLAAQSMSVAGVWEYYCSAQNIGATAQTLSVAGFALDFPELAQISPADVLDIFTQKQARSWQARIALSAEIVGIGALLASGPGGWVLTAAETRDIGIAAYISSKAGPYFASKEPSITNATTGMLTQDQPLAPGASYQWKLYASNSVNPPIRPLSRKASLRLAHPGIPARILTNGAVIAPRASNSDPGIFAGDPVCTNSCMDRMEAELEPRWYAWVRPVADGL